MGIEYESLTSEDLMHLIMAEDKNAFRVLISRHTDAVYKVIYKFIGNEEEANDLAQEVFLRIWRFSKRYQPTSKFTTWLYTITANVCKTEVQSLWRRNIRLIGSLWSADDNDDQKFPEPASPLLSPESAAIQAQQSHLVRSAIRSLPHKQRLALVLSRYEELPYQEIATVLGCSVPAVEALLARAKASLQKKLAPHQK